ncbi:MAG: FG-GAP-like repeat-containing protein [Planctomycetota bacterium]
MNTLHVSSSVAALLVLSACGAGTAAAVSGGSDESGGNAAASIANFAVIDAQVPALCRVEFVVRDAEGDPTDVELLYSVPGQPEQRITHIAPIVGVPVPSANPGSLASSASGVLYAFQWDFAAEALLPDDGGFVEGARVIARLDGASALAPSSNTHAGIGNDPPEVIAAHAPKDAEVIGIAAVPFAVTDSSSDPISIQVEYDIVGDVPDAGWRIARPAGLAPGAPTPDFAFRGVVAPPDPGVELVFFWNTNIDLLDLEHDVALRFTPSDAVVVGASASTPSFHVDNNAAPIATVSGDLLLLNTDVRRGVPIPYTIRDEESDDVQVVLQWKHPEDDFPPLPNTLAEIGALLADPAQRELLHICSEHPTWVEGGVVPIDSSSVRLPELATSASSILADVTIVGREIEILRASSIPAPIASTWSANPLQQPVAVLPLGDGIEAIVLDRAAPGAWRLRQLDLATGVVTRELVASAPGEPNAMTFERDETSVLVASDIGGAWQVTRVLLADGSVASWIAFDGTTEAGRVRGIASVGSHVALITLSSSLIRLAETGPGAAQATTLFDDLSMPWGIAVDPLARERVYVAEHDAPTGAGFGRIVVIDLDRRERNVLTFGARDPRADVVHAPRALALDPRAGRLFVVQDLDPPVGTVVRAIDIGSASATAAFTASPSLAGDVGSIATGRDGLVVLALSSEDDLAVGGGLEQRRTVEAFDLAPRIAHVSVAFDPALHASQRYRVEQPRVTPRATPAGARGVFLWNSEDARAGGELQFRATPMDAEHGVDGTTDGAKRIRSALDTDPIVLGDASLSNLPQCVVSADIDGDGDLDLVSANTGGDTITVFFQTSSGVFGSAPLSLGDTSVTNDPMSVAAADMDDDGDLDIASANRGNDTLTVFFQTSPGAFAGAPLALGGPGITTDPQSVVAADLDGDGDLDLASANSSTHTLTVFFQTSAGAFAVVPVVLGGPGITSVAQSVTAGDLDGDGDLDLATANSGSNTVTVFFQTSPGVFASTPLALGDPSTSPVSVTAADLDGDGDLDLATANFTVDNIGSVTVYFQTNRGVFARAPLTLSGTGGGGAVRAADLDGDGDLDLVSANPLESTLTVFFQTSPGVFAAEPLTLGDSNVTNQPSYVEPADLDGDGDVDLASANRAGHTLTVFLQASSGAFGSLPLSFGNSSITIRPRSVAMGDMDDDGDLDVVSANSISNTLTIFMQSSPGVFAGAPLTLGDVRVTPFPTSVAPADIDGDGDLDLVCANMLNVTVHFQTSPGVFGSSPLALESDGGLGAIPRSVAAVDLDLDGDLDVVSPNPSSDTLTISFQTSPGVFAAPPLLLGSPSVTDQPTSVIAADLDGDLDLDLVSANQAGDNLAVFFQTSPGTFDPVPTTLGDASVSDGALKVAAADLDGDGDLDLVAACQNTDALSIFFQTSPGKFGAVPLLVGNSSITDSVVAVAAADIDHDGDVDLVAGGNGADTLTVFLQTSPGVFGVASVLGGPTVTNLPFSIALGDIDGDGDVDIVSANQSSNTCTVFWNGH